MESNDGFAYRVNPRGELGFSAPVTASVRGLAWGEGGVILRLGLPSAERRAETLREGLRSTLLTGGIPCVISFRTSMSGSERGLRASKPKVKGAVLEVGEPKRNGGEILSSVAGFMGGASWNGSSATSIGALLEGPAAGTSNARVCSRNRFEVAEGDVAKNVSDVF